MTDRPAGPGDHGVSFASAFRVWLRVAALSFGGPAGQIAVMHRIIVEEKRWVGEARFLHALGYCTLLPGPEAQQLATYLGWLMHRTWGGVMAGVLFVLPGAVSILALSIVYALYGEVGPVAALFFGLKAAVLAVVVQAVIRLGRRALRNRTMVGLAVAAFLALFLLGVPFPLVVLAAGVLGAVGAAAGVRALLPASFAGAAGAGLPIGRFETAYGDGLPAHARLNARAALRSSVLWLSLWLVPVVLVGALLGWESTFARIAVFFSQVAVVTFGGAYAVLAYVAQQAVESFGWLAPGEMLDGLGMAETTPGPLIMVLQFVGFLAAYRDAASGVGGLSPLWAGTLGAALTTWVTFAPCFFFIFLGAPFIEALRGNRVLNAALGAITAAVVGVIMNLAVWFAQHTLFAAQTRVELGPVGLPVGLDVPVLASVDGWALLLAVAAGVALFRLGAGVITTLLACAAAGLLLQVAGLRG